MNEKVKEQIEKIKKQMKPFEKKLETGKFTEEDSDSYSKLCLQLNDIFLKNIKDPEKIKKLKEYRNDLEKLANFKNPFKKIIENIDEERDKTRYIG